MKLALVVAVALLAGCKSGAKAPIECRRKAADALAGKLDKDQMTQLCSGATDADQPIACFQEALDADLSLNAYGALLLCSRFNLDAHNAQTNARIAADKQCPSTDLSEIERRLRRIEDKIDELPKKR
jgi:hypothetical protein